MRASGKHWQDFPVEHIQAPLSHKSFELMTQRYFIKETKPISSSIFRGKSCLF